MSILLFGDIYKNRIRTNTPIAETIYRLDNRRNTLTRGQGTYRNSYRIYTVFGSIQKQQNNKSPTEIQTIGLYNIPGNR
jgi:hypothetical protein